MRKLLSLTALATAGTLAFGAQARDMLTVETAVPGQGPYVAAATLGEVASQAGIADFQVLDSQTLTNSVQNVAEGKTDVATSALILPFLMSRGAGPYAKLGKEKGGELASNLSVLFTFTFGNMCLYSYDSSSVNGWDDLEGKKIINGPRRGAALASARALIKIVTGLDDGKDYQGVQASWGQLTKTVTDGSADGVVLPMNFPNARITQASASGAITLYSTPKKAWESPAMKKFLKSPGTAGFTIAVADLPEQEGISIHSEDGIWRSPATTGAMIVHKDMDFDMAKSLTALAIKNVDVFKTKAPFMKFSQLGETDPDLTGMCGAVPTKYHPGAIAAWEEAGLTVPDCAKP